VAFAVTSLGSVADTNARSAHTCSITRAPADGTLVLVQVAVSDAVGTPVQPTSLEGAGLNWSMIGSSITYAPITVGSQLGNLSVWQATGSSLVSSFITANFANASTGCAMLVTEISGSTRVGQSASSVRDGGSALTIYAPSALSAPNAWFSALGIAEGVSADGVGENYTLIDSAVYATPAFWTFSAWTTLSTGTTVTWFRASSSEQRGGFLIEILDPSSASQAVTGTPQWVRGHTALDPRMFQARVRPAVVEPGRTRSTDPYTDTTEQ
jgi:hypothetical protein